MSLYMHMSLAHAHIVTNVNIHVITHTHAWCVYVLRSRQPRQGTVQNSSLCVQENVVLALPLISPCLEMLPNKIDDHVGVLHGLADSVSILQVKRLENQTNITSLSRDGRAKMFCRLHKPHITAT